MKKLFITLATFAISLTGMSQSSKTIQLLEAGTLSRLLTADEKNKLTDLTITGNIDAQDFKCMRDEITHLEKLDLTHTKIEFYSGKNGSTPLTKSNDYPIDELPQYAFYNYSAGKTSLKTIALPTSIKAIAFNAFKSCANLQAIIIPDSVTCIGESAFANCVNMLQVTLPKALKRIDNSAFINCQQLTTINLPNALDNIAMQSFQDCTNLTTLSFGKSIGYIADAAFAFCTSLQTVNCIATLPPTVANSAFDLTNIQCISVPKNSSKSYTNHAFWKRYKICNNN